MWLKDGGKGGNIKSSKSEYKNTQIGLLYVMCNSEVHIKKLL